jgi:hypothetical protein
VRGKYQSRTLDSRRMPSHTGKGLSRNISGNSTINTITEASRSIHTPLPSVTARLNRT